MRRCTSLSCNRQSGLASHRSLMDSPFETAMKAASRMAVQSLFNGAGAEVACFVLASGAPSAVRAFFFAVFSRVFRLIVAIRCEFSNKPIPIHGSQNGCSHVPKSFLLGYSTCLHIENAIFPQEY